MTIPTVKCGRSRTLADVENVVVCRDFEHVSWCRDRARVYHGVLAWTDASVGAAFGAVLVPLLAGGVLLLDRGWVNAQLPARSRPR